jgi:outer membrane murein-binding lipoprotein Lpp
MVGKRGMALGAAVVALGLSAGCVQPPPDAEARLAALEAEGQQMDAALDTVEERLLGNQARMHLWQELGERHKSVSAIHCKHADANLAAILEHEERQEEKARKLKRSRHVASADATVLSSVQVPASGQN